jgi:WD40 repeat protein
MAKKQSAPRHLYLLFHRHTLSQDPGSVGPGDWWLGNCERYALVATIMATSVEQARLLAEPQQGGWYHHSAVVLQSITSLRDCRAGDVLLVDNQYEGRQTWMIIAGRWTVLPEPQTEAPVHLDGQQKEILSVAWSPDGKRFAACGGQGLVRVYTLGSSYAPDYNTHAGIARAVAWSPGGERIATGDGNDATHIWDVAEDTSTTHLADAASGRILICREGGQPIFYKGAYAVAWSPDTLRVAAGNHLGIVRIWSAETGRCEARYRHQDVVRAVAWSPAGRLLASASADCTVLVWNRDYFRIEYAIQAGQLTQVNALAWSPTGDHFLLGGSGGNFLQLHEARTGNLVRTIGLSRYTGVEEVLSVAYAPGGHYAVAGCADGTIQVVNVAGARHIHTYYGHSGRVNAVAWSPVGGLIASGGEDTRVRVWAAPPATLPVS